MESEHNKVIGYSKEVLHVLLLLTLSGFLFLFMLGSYYLFDKDEPRYAEAAREMMEAANYIVPQFNYEPRYEKPILFYWLEIVSFKIFGVNEFAARLPSALMSMGLLLLCYKFGNLVRVGFTSSLILLTSFEYFFLSRMSITDMTLNFCVSGTLICFFFAYSDLELPSVIKLRRGKWVYFAYICTALGVLAKGPVAILLPAFIVLVFLLLNKNLVNLINRYRRELLKGSLLFLVLVLPWYVAVHVQTDGEFTKFFFINENFNRYFGHIGQHGKSPWWFYVPVVLVGFMPWTLFFILFSCLSLRAKRSNRSDVRRSNPVKSEQSLILFCICWSSIIFVFYSLSGVKLVNYILPIYLPLAVLTAHWYKSADTSASSQIQRSGKWVEKLFVTVFAVFYLGYLVAIPAFVIPYNHERQTAIAKFVKTVPYNSRLISLGVAPQSAVFYSRGKIEELNKHDFITYMNSKEEIFFIFNTKGGNFNKIRDKIRSCEIINNTGKYIFGATKP